MIAGAFKNLCLYKLLISCHYCALCSNMIGFLVSSQKHKHHFTPFDAVVDLKMNTCQADSDRRSNFSLTQNGAGG